MTSTINPARHSFSNTQWIAVGHPRLEEFVRIGDSGSIQRYISRAGATVRFSPLTENDTVAVAQTIQVRGSVCVLVQREPGFEDQDHWILSIPAWAIVGYDSGDDSGPDDV